ncbi:unnamed protein product [Phytomonas sp. Hart1]|nr:unnamed protein product [Phytomonas sp. Hart1]|eukprot:CCW72110.1 unnamed protein product [Phytomonas sp. isolate Hart1]
MLRRTGHRLKVATKRPQLTLNNMSGFELLSVRSIDDLNLVAYAMRHTATGASYYHVDIEDNNNVFCIGFRTPAEDNKGTSHVLEHTVLCGSQKYPVRDPFFAMLQRSLSNFMNAMTGADYTLYPFATTNVRDFSNLMDVYLDAVFRPLLREEDFKVEGHRIEIASENSETGVIGEDGAATKQKECHTDASSIGKKRLVHNGVVFNEMRGVVSEPNHHFAHCLMRTMLPETHYTYISGGYPPDILKLTYTDLVSFHKRHYHPSNSITFTYGSQHPGKYMQLLDTYFSFFKAAEPVNIPTLSEHCRFKEPKIVRLEGPLDIMGNIKQQKRIAVSYGVPQEENSISSVVNLSVLDSLLCSGPSSPMYKAIIESQIGSKYAPMRGYEYYLSSPIFSYGVSGVDEDRPGVEEEVLQAVTSALVSTKDNGFDPRRVNSVIFQEELQQRHRSSNYGINLCTNLCATGLCRTYNDPLDFINWLPHLKKLGQNNGTSLLPYINSIFLNNPNRAVISVSAKENFLGSLRKQLQAEDDALNNKATEDDVKCVEHGMEESLKRLRAPQQKEMLPTLEISDIPKKSFSEPLPQTDGSDVATSTINFPTNGLVYVHGLVPFSMELIKHILAGDLDAISPNMPIVHSLLANTGTRKHSFKEQSVEIELACGGFSFTPILNESYTTKNSTISGASFEFYTTKEKLKESLQLLAEALLEPRTNSLDPEVYTCTLSRLKMICTSIIQSLQSSGDRVAVSRAVSKLTQRGVLHEHWWGLTHSKHVSELLKQLQGGEDERRGAVEKLLTEYNNITASLCHSMSCAVLWATCEANHRVEVEQLLNEFRAKFTASDSATSSGSLPTRLTLPTLQAPTCVQSLTDKLPIDTSYVGFALPNALSWQHPDQAALRVACTLLQNKYLHRRVREEGGAYGLRVSPTLQGQVGGVTMSSYRDPSPNNTIKAISEAADWIADVRNITAESLREAKLRLFSSIDAPYAADSYGEGYFLNDIHQELKQNMRDALLQVNEKDIVKMADFFSQNKQKYSVSSILQPIEVEEV